MRNTGSQTAGLQAGEDSHPSGDELAALQDQLAESRAEVERLQNEAADAEARAATALGEAAALRDELAAAQTSQTSQTSAAGEALSARRFVEQAEARLRAAAEKYREMVVRTEPALPAELIIGDDIDEIDESVVAAREIVERVRGHLESQARSSAAAARVPAGSPPRGAADHSALSPEEKIRLGLQQRAS